MLVASDLGQKPVTDGTEGYVNMAAALDTMLSSDIEGILSR